MTGAPVERVLGSASLPCRTPLKNLLTRGGCRQPGLLLEGFLGSPRSCAAEACGMVAQEAAALGVAPEFTSVFERWHAVLELLGAVSWEAGPGDPLPVALASKATPERPVVLHPTYAVPCLPAGLLRSLAASVGETERTKGDQESHASAQMDVGTGAELLRRITFLDALYIPGSAPDDRPLVPDPRAAAGRVGELDAGGAPGTSGPPGEVPWWRPALAATGRYLVSVVGPTEDASVARERLDRAMGLVWGGREPRVTPPGFEEPLAASEVIPPTPRREREVPEQEAAAEMSPSEEAPVGPTEWGMCTVILSPQDGSLHATGPQGEKGEARRAEASALINGLPARVQERLTGRKRRARLRVTVEPMGNVWKITGLMSTDG